MVQASRSRHHHEPSPHSFAFSEQPSISVPEFSQSKSHQLIENRGDVSYEGRSEDVDSRHHQRNQQHRRQQSKPIHVTLNDTSEGPQKPQVQRFRQNMLFGLENEDLANNCFINVVVQNIWHLNGFKHVLKEIILEYDSLNRDTSDRIVYELSKLLKEIKEQREGNIHSVADLKKAVLTEMFGRDGFNWNEQADACEAMLLILNKVHEHFKATR